MPRFLTPIVAFLFLFAAALPCDAAAKKKPNAEEPKKAEKKPEPIQVPFDASMTTVSESSVNSVYRVYRALKANRDFFKKNEFETTKQFEGRIASLQDKILIDNLHYNDPIAFLSPLVGSQYDADNGTMRLKWGHHNNNMTIMWAKLEENTVKTSNGPVVVTHTASYQVEMSNKNQPTPPYEIDIPMPPEEARNVSKSSGIVVVGKLQLPYVDARHDHFPPNDKNNELFTNDYTINMEVSEIWIVNRKTGKIYAKKKVSELKEGPRFSY